MRVGARGPVPAGSGDRPAALLRPMTPEDWPSVATIYGEGIATGDATFETRGQAWGRGQVAGSPRTTIPTCSERFVDASPTETVATWLDEGVCLSERARFG